MYTIPLSNKRLALVTHIHVMYQVYLLIYCYPWYLGDISTICSFLMDYGPCDRQFQVYYYVNDITIRQPLPS
ncbi:hypothetical protein BJX66DRAFT_310637 [Aspergillus keveii]|uniref:Uncharacterized protein n=1 Tax=Aspergillus keveii TaxID=714993 RepID=A0ABR4FWA8_9EURO